MPMGMAGNQLVILHVWVGFSSRLSKTIFEGIFDIYKIIPI